MLGALVLCSPNEHVFCCTLLTLWCACVNTLREASEGPCSAVLCDLIWLMTETCQGLYRPVPGATTGDPTHDKGHEEET